VGDVGLDLASQQYRTRSWGHRPVLKSWRMKSEARRLNKLSGASRSVAKRYKLTTAAAEIIDKAGQIHGQKSRAVQIAVEILWRTTGISKIPSAILQSPITARTYKLPHRTVDLIEVLGVCPSIRKSSFKSTTGCVRRGTRLQPVARKVITRTHS